MLRRESHISNVAPRPRLAIDPLAEIIYDNEVETRASALLCPRNSVSTKYPVKYFDDFQHSHLKPGFLQQLARYALLQRLAELQRPSGDRPLTLQGFTSAFDQQRSAVFYDYAAHANHWPLRIFSGRGHFGNLF
jgi:hypothetical protein